MRIVISLKAQFQKRKSIIGSCIVA